MREMHANALWEGAIQRILGFLCFRCSAFYQCFYNWPLFVSDLVCWTGDNTLIFLTCRINLLLCVIKPGLNSSWIAPVLSSGCGVIFLKY